MSKCILHAIVASAGSIAAVTTLWGTQAQAAVLTYESDLNVTATVVLPNQSTAQTPIANAAVIFTKAPSVAQPGLFDYEFKSFTGKLLNATYTTADLLSPANITFVAGLNALLPSKYQTLLPAILNNTTPTYTGDGGFPPADPISYTFSSQDVSAGVSLVAPHLSPTQLNAVNTIAALFPNGGEATLSSTLIPGSSDSSSASFTTLIASNPSSSAPSEGVPEPTTIAGLALAGAGMIAARRRLNRRKTIAS